MTPEGNFTLTYFPYNQDAVPQTPLEEAIQNLNDCLPCTDEETLQNTLRYGHQRRPLTRKKKRQLKAFINNVLLPACEEGNQDAIYWMFMAYLYGLGVEEDCDKALEYLTIIANYGYPDMQCELGKEYATIDWSCTTKNGEELEKKNMKRSDGLQKRSNKEMWKRCSALVNVIAMVRGWIRIMKKHSSGSQKPLSSVMRKPCRISLFSMSEEPVWRKTSTLPPSGTTKLAGMKKPRD